MFARAAEAGRRTPVAARGTGSLVRCRLIVASPAACDMASASSNSVPRTASSGTTASTPAASTTSAIDRRQRQRHRQVKARALGRFGLHRDRSAQPLHGGAHDIKADAAAGDLGYRIGGGEAAPQQQAHQFLGAHPAGGGRRHPAPLRRAPDRVEIDPAPVVAARKTIRVAATAICRSRSAPTPACRRHGARPGSRCHARPRCAPAAPAPPAPWRGCRRRAGRRLPWPRTRSPCPARGRHRGQCVRAR